MITCVTCHSDEGMPCDRCYQPVCPKCAKELTYIRPRQQVNGVETSPLHSSVIRLLLCPVCYENFDPVE